MKVLRPLPLLTVVLVFAVLSIHASPAAAFPLRSPQVPLCPGTLWADFMAFGETYDPGLLLTQQIDAQVWATNVSGISEFDLMLELEYATVDEIGIYNADGTGFPLFRVFPGAAQAGWYATLKFKAPDSLIVRLFDADANDQGRWSYGGVQSGKFGFYLHRDVPAAVTYYSQDVRNAGGQAQVLTYPGTGRNLGDYWICFEATDYGYPDCPSSDFADALFLVQSMNPVGVRPLSWGALKTRYR